MTISENIALALAINQAPAAQVEPRIAEMAERLNIGDILDKYPIRFQAGKNSAVPVPEPLSTGRTSPGG